MLRPCTQTGMSSTGCLQQGTRSSQQAAQSAAVSTPAGRRDHPARHKGLTVSQWTRAAAACGRGSPPSYLHIDVPSPPASMLPLKEPVVLLHPLPTILLRRGCVRVVTLRCRRFEGGATQHRATNLPPQGPAPFRGIFNPGVRRRRCALCPRRRPPILPPTSPSQPSQRQQSTRRLKRQCACARNLNQNYSLPSIHIWKASLAHLRRHDARADTGEPHTCAPSATPTPPCERRFTNAMDRPTRSATLQADLSGVEGREAP